MSAPNGGHRATDGPRTGKLWVFARRAYWWWTAVVPALAIGIALYAVLEVDGTVKDIQAEGVDRRDQTCIVFERDAISAKTAYVDAKEALDRTNNYLKTLTPEERKTRINAAVIAGVPRLEETVDRRWRDAKATAAPPYCDEPNVGLEEPNPALPARPR